APARFGLAAGFRFMRCCLRSIVQSACPWCSGACNAAASKEGCTMRKLQSLVGFVVCGWLSWTGMVHADAVTDWNHIAVQALAAAMPSRPGSIVFLDVAIVQAAVHDAVQAIDKRFKPYTTSIPGATGSPDAAAAKAA